MGKNAMEESSGLEDRRVPRKERKWLTALVGGCGSGDNSEPMGGQRRGELNRAGLVNNVKYKESEENKQNLM
jgi:hypothetical protein